jgi:hypothetical protein
MHRVQVHLLICNTDAAVDSSESMCSVSRSGVAIHKPTGGMLKNLQQHQSRPVDSCSHLASNRNSRQSNQTPSLPNRKHAAKTHLMSMIHILRRRATGSFASRQAGRDAQEAAVGVR